MFDKLTLRDMELKGKRVLLRVDFNVPLNSNLQITNDKRIRETLPTINYLIERGAKIIIVSHLGRPEGKVMPEFSLKPVAEHLRTLLKKPIMLANDVAGSETYKYVRTMQAGDIVMMENVRFDPREEENDAEFAKELAGIADVYCNDAFGTMHRTHTSTCKIAEYLPSCVGFLVEKELSVLGGALSNPKRPFVVIIGGAKIKDKIALISRLIDVADVVLIGGAMAYTFLRAQGFSMGRSVVEKDKIQLARLLLEKAKMQGVKIVLPIDHVVTGEFSFSAHSVNVSTKKFPRAGIGMDIGPATTRLFKYYISKAHTVLWNGPLGVAEFHKFAKGTDEVAKALAEAKAFTIIGGGDSAKCVEQLKLQSQINHISTGGGASLKLLESGSLPGLDGIANKGGM
ncbi:MAG: phosphoglycerate kinase [Clostridia bacterium]|nr:phosphoglycerate kinase [Clostridia bacterium]